MPILASEKNCRTDINVHLIAGTNTYESLIHALRDKLEKMSEMVNHLCLRKVIDKMSGVQNGLKSLMKWYIRLFVFFVTHPISAKLGG